MNYTLSFLLAVSLLFTAWIIDIEETKITELEHNLSVSQTALDIAKSPYFIQHSPHCSDSWLFE